MAIQVDYDNLNSWLSSQPVNTKNNPYEITIVNFPMSDADRINWNEVDIGEILRSNLTKYVDLSTTVLDFHGFNWILPEFKLNQFEDCTNLIKAPIWINISPDFFLGLRRTYKNCTNLISISFPTITDTSRSIQLEGMFEGCSSLVNIPEIPYYVSNLRETFKDCTSLVNAPVIPDRVRNMAGCFCGCTSLIQAPVIPEGVTTIAEYEGIFEGCTSLTIVPYIPSTITSLRGLNGHGAFKGCSSLQRIEVWKAPKELFEDASNCFAGCDNLSYIGMEFESTPSEEDNWNIYRLKIGTSTIEGKVFDGIGNTTNIPQITISRSSIKLPIQTDELWFPDSSYANDAAIEAVIQKVIQYRYSYWKKTVLSPENKSFVIWADDPDYVKSNIPTNVNEASGVLPVTHGGTGQTSLNDVTVGTATVATTASNLDGKLVKAVKNWTWLDLSTLNASYWYPVTFSLSTDDWTEVECYVSLDSGTKPSWSTHDDGFTCHLHLFAMGSGWGTTSAQTFVLDRQSRFANVIPCGWTQMTNSSTGVLWLRGGGKYRAWNNKKKTFTIRTSTYTVSSQSVAPTTSYQWSFATANLWGYLNGDISGNAYSATIAGACTGNAATATTASTASSATNADKLDGYHAGTSAGQLIPVSAQSWGSGSGYIKYANGLIIQWGTTNSVTSSGSYIYYPIAFTTIPMLTTSINKEEGGNGVQIYVYSKSTSTCQIIVKSVSGGGWYSRPISWIAVGY